MKAYEASAKEALYDHLDDAFFDLDADLDARRVEYIRGHQKEFSEIDWGRLFSLCHCAAHEGRGYREAEDGLHGPPPPEEAGDLLEGGSDEAVVFLDDLEEPVAEEGVVELVGDHDDELLPGLRGVHKPGLHGSRRPSRRLPLAGMPDDQHAELGHHGGQLGDQPDRVVHHHVKAVELLA